MSRTVLVQVNPAAAIDGDMAMIPLPVEVSTLTRAGRHDQMDFDARQQEQREQTMGDGISGHGRRV